MQVARLAQQPPIHAEPVCAAMDDDLISFRQIIYAVDQGAELAAALLVVIHSQRPLPVVGPQRRGRVASSAAETGSCPPAHAQQSAWPPITGRDRRVPPRCPGSAATRRSQQRLASQRHAVVRGEGISDPSAETMAAQRARCRFTPTAAECHTKSAKICLALAQTNQDTDHAHSQPVGRYIYHQWRHCLFRRRLHPRLGNSRHPPRRR